MYIIVYDHNCQQSREVIAAVNYNELREDIEKRPEDYIFLLTPVEYSKYMELNRWIFAIAQGKQVSIDEEIYIKHYPEVFIIATIAPQPDFVKKYKIADMIKPELVGNNHIVFYINRTDQPKERAQRVLKRIAELKAELPRHTEQ